MMAFAKRFTANDLLQEGIISAALPYDELIEGAKNTVRPWVNKGRKSDGSLSTMGGIKQRLYTDAYDALQLPRTNSSKL